MSPKVETIVCLAILASVLLVHSATADSPAFCHGLDCPKYTVLKTFPTYELRRYEMTQWVADRVMQSATLAQQNNRGLFFNLFYYISGNNTAGMKIPMTAPVVTKVIPGSDSNPDNTYEMHFMIPHNMQPFPPMPTESNVYITMMPPMDFYVKSFGGVASELLYMAHLSELKYAINNSSAYYSTHYYTAGYDGPYAVKRHNEVWLAAKA